MQFSHYSAEIASRLLVRRLFLYVLVISLFVNLVLAVGLAAKEDRERIIVLPAEPTKSFWIDNHKVSSEYLEQMAVYLLQLVLNNSPETVTANAAKILSYVVPEERGHVQLMLTKEARLLKASNASSSFIAQSVHTDPDLLTAVIQGRNRRFIGSQQTANLSSCWKVAFEYTGSRLWVKHLDEADCKKPYEDGEAKDA